MAQEISFDEWFERLLFEADMRMLFSIDRQSKYDWREYYDNDFTPVDALDEDTRAGM